MNAAEAEIVMQYYAQLGKMRRWVKMEAEELEAEYSTLRGGSMDGMPKAGGADVVCDAAVKMAEDGTADRLRELAVKEAVLRQDQDDVRRALMGLRDVYRQVLVLRYEKKRRWTAIGEAVKYSESQTRRMKTRALEMLAEGLAEGPMPGELLARARAARA